MAGKKEDGRWQITDLAGFINGTGLVKNKDIPGFDAMDLGAENNAFGTADTEAVHYPPSVAEMLQKNYDRYQGLEGFDQEQIDLYIQNALTGQSAFLLLPGVFKEVRGCYTTRYTITRRISK